MSKQATFQSLTISESLIKKLENKNILTPTAVQQQIIPKIAEGKSVIFQSETGTGKTFAYLLPLLTKFESDDSNKTIQSESQNFESEKNQREIKLIIAAPTYELASQIKTQVTLLTDLKCCLLIGGVSLKRQIENLKEKPVIIVGGPARIAELFRLKKLKLHTAQAIVLDEVDRLLSPELKNETISLLDVLKKNIQLIACSATITKQTQNILLEAKSRSRKLNTNDFSEIEIENGKEIETIFLPEEDVLRKKITHIAIFAERRDKIETLRKVLSAEKPEKALVFTSKSDQVELITSKLKFKKVNCEALYAKTNKSKRKSAIDRFRSGKCPILITSDLASRGLDIENITHIIQTDLPSNQDFFIHRAGRTARAGKTGINIVIGDAYELKKYSRLEKKLKIIVYPKILYKGKLIAPDQYYDDLQENNSPAKSLST